MFEYIMMVAVGAQVYTEEFNLDDVYGICSIVMFEDFNLWDRWNRKEYTSNIMEVEESTYDSVMIRIPKQIVRILLAPHWNLFVIFYGVDHP